MNGPDTSLALDTALTGMDTLRKQIAVLTLPEPRKKSMHYKMGNRVLKESRLNIKKQQTVSGSPMEPRKKHRVYLTKKGKVRRDGKMFQRILKSASKVPVRVSANPEDGKVYFPNPVAGAIAYRHQYGIPLRFTRNRTEIEKLDGMCPESMAWRLRNFTWKASGGRSVHRSVDWIMENIKAKNAAQMLLVMRAEDNVSLKTGAEHYKKEWVIPYPARPFLGLSEQQRRQLGEDIVNTILNKMQRKLQ